MDRPVIFLSAVSAEFRELRQLLHDSFKTHFHVITQDDTLHKFPGGDVRQLLSDAIDGSHAVLHLAGAGFGSTAAAPFPEIPGFLCSWTQYEYYYAHSFDGDPVHRKQIFAIVCGPTLRSPTFTEKDDATLTAAQKAPLQEAHCQRIFSGKFDATPLASLPRTVNHGQPINDNAAALRAAIDICAQLATRQPAFQSACALVQVSLQDQLQPLLDAQLRIEKKQKRLLLLSLCTLAVLALVGGGIVLLRIGQEKAANLQAQASAQLVTQMSEVKSIFSKERKFMALILGRANERIKEWENMAPAQRFDLALDQIAAEQKIPARELRDLLDLYVQRVEADPDAEAEDKYYLLMRKQAFDQAAKLAATEGRTAEERMKQQASRKAAAKAIQENATVQEDLERQRAVNFYHKEGAAYQSTFKFEKALVAFEKASRFTDKYTELESWFNEQTSYGEMLFELARYEESESVFREILNTVEIRYGIDSGWTALACHDLAMVLVRQNQLEKAELLMRRALEIDESKFGSFHPTISVRISQLAQLLVVTNKLPEAESLMKRALEIDERSYGENHPTVAIRLSNLAVLYQETNRLEEAMSLMKRALEIDENAYSKVHLIVARDINNMAVILKYQNRFKDAEVMMRKVVSIFEKIYGRDHPKVAIAIGNLAVLLQDTNCLYEAEILMKRALRIDEATYGKNHPDVARDLNNLAQILQGSNRNVEAEPLLRRALEIYEASYGKNHPSFATSLYNLALLLKVTDRSGEAESLTRQAIGIHLAFQAQTGNRTPNSLLFTSGYISLARELSYSDAETHSKLESMRKQVGLAQPAFEALWTEALAANYTGPYLVTVDEAVADSQGLALGIQPGDVILRYHGQAITSMDQLIQLTGEVKDEAILLEIQRGKEILKLTLKPGKLGVKIQNVMPPAPAE